MGRLQEFISLMAAMRIILDSLWTYMSVSRIMHVVDLRFLYIINGTVYDPIQFLYFTHIELLRIVVILPGRVALKAILK